MNKKGKIVVGNWKMHPLTLKEAEKLFSSVAKEVARAKKTQIVICPPYIYLQDLKKLSKKVTLGAQDSFVGDIGAFTGEVSADMLYELGARHVILGHSERRAMGENNALINKKLKSALNASLTPILCIGERERDESHEYFNLVKMQVKECLNGINKNSVPKIIFAYEPVWAISSTVGRRDATAADSREMAVFIRKVLSDLYNPQVANNTRVIYGGSVTDKDAGDFLKDGGVDGVLPGRASLDSKKFIEIVKVAERL